MDLTPSDAENCLKHSAKIYMWGCGHAGCRNYELWKILTPIPTVGNSTGEQVSSGIQITSLINQTLAQTLAVRFPLLCNSPETMKDMKRPEVLEY